jgi:hypothetical protein
LSSSAELRSNWATIPSLDEAKKQVVIAELSHGLI